MSAFQDMVAKDRDILLNTDEFGEEHEIDGKIVVCVIGSSELKESDGAAEYTVAKSCKTVFAKCEDLPKKKGYGAELMVDGIPYMVQTWDEDMGMAEVVLSIAFSQ